MVVNLKTNQKEKETCFKKTVYFYNFCQIACLHPT